MLEHNVYIAILVSGSITDMQEAHEAVYEVHQDQQQMQAHLTADLAHQEQVSCSTPCMSHTKSVYVRQGSLSLLSAFGGCESSKSLAGFASKVL